MKKCIEHISGNKYRIFKTNIIMVILPEYRYQGLLKLFFCRFKLLLYSRDISKNVSTISITPQNASMMFLRMKTRKKHKNASAYVRIMILYKLDAYTPFTFSG